MNIKRIIAALLLSSTVFTAAACASDTSTSAETTASGAGEAVETTAAETTTASEYTPPKVDYEGQTFAVASNKWDPSRRPWKICTYVDIKAEEENGDPINDALFQRNIRVEEELNVKFTVFEITEQSRTTEMTTAVLSGDDMFKFASTNMSSLRTLLNTQGMTTDLYELPTFDYEASWWDENSREELEIYGRLHAISGDFNLYSNGAPICNFFSKVLVENLGLDNPYDVVNDGAWTLDTMLKYAEAAVKDVNGDGQMVATDDCWGLMGEAGSTLQFIRSADQRFSTRSGDGDIEIVINTEKTVNVIGKVIPFLRDKGKSLYSPDFSKQYTNVFFELLLPRFIDNNAMFFSNQLYVALELRNMEADFGILPMPKYDEKQENYVSPTNAAYHTFVIVPITNSVPEMTGNILNSLGYYSQQLITPAFIDQTVMSKAIRDEESAEMVRMIYDTRAYDVATFYNWGNVATMVSTMTGNSSVNFASEYAAIETNILTALNETIELLKQ